MKQECFNDEKRKILYKKFMIFAQKLVFYFEK